MDFISMPVVMKNVQSDLKLMQDGAIVKRLIKKS